MLTRTDPRELSVGRERDAAVAIVRGAIAYASALQGFVAKLTTCVADQPERRTRAVAKIA